MGADKRKGFCKTFVKALNIALLLSVIVVSVVVSELGVEKRHLKNNEEDFLEFWRDASALLKQ